MKPLLYITAALILIAAIVPVHADQGVVGSFTLPGTLNYTYAEISAVCAPYGGVLNGEAGSQARFTNYNAAWVATGGSQTAHETYTYTNPAEVTGATYVRLEAYCVASNYHPIKSYVYGPAPFVVANFTGTPTQGAGPLSVVLTDTSTNTTYTNMTYNWSFVPATGWYVTAGTINDQNVEIAFVTNGNYTVTHGAASTVFGSDIETKTDYIWVYNSTSLLTTQIWAIDGTSEGYPIQGAQIDIQDIENSSWTNTTTGANGKAEITTLAGHTFNAYGSATGFSPADLLAQPVGGGYQLVMFRQGATDVSDGNVTLYVTVVDDDTTFRIASADVTAAWGTLYTATKTDSAGIAQMTVPNNTAIHVSAFKAGYAGASKTISSGTGSGGDASVSVEIRLAKSVVTTVPTTTGNGTAVTTVDPYPCIGDGSAEDNANCQRKQGGMAADLITMGPTLVQFFIMLTFLGGIMLITKRR